MGSSKQPIGYLAMTGYIHTLNAKDYEDQKLPYVHKEYGVRTSEDSVLNCGKNKLAAQEAAAASGGEVVFHSVSDWLPLSDEG